MKKVVNGCEKGYLFEREEFEKKLKEFFPVLRNLQHFEVYVSNLSVMVKMHSYICKEGDRGIMFNESDDKQWFAFDMSLFQDIFGIKERINFVSFMYKHQEGKYRPANFKDTFFSKNGFYYFVEVSDMAVYDNMVEVK